MQKSNPVTLEDHPTRDMKQLHVVIARDVDVRYMKNLLNFTDRFRSPNCNEQHCPTMRERWDRHIHEHHSMSSNNQPSVLHSISPPIKVRDQAISASSTLSALRVPTFISQQNNDARAAQTDLTSADLSRLDFISKHLTRKFETPIPRVISNPDTPIKDESATLNISETRSVIPEKSFYKEHLKGMVSRWLKDLPLHSIMTDKNKQKQENMLNNLIENVYKLAINAGNHNYEETVKYEIDSCLKRLPLWSPGAENDKIQFTYGLRDNLWIGIKGLNDKYLVNADINNVIDRRTDISNREENSTHNSYTNIRDNEVTVASNENDLNLDENVFEKEILQWINTNLNDEDIDRFETAELILKQLEPLLNESLHNAKYKLLLKGKIFDVLENLSLNSSVLKNKTLRLNRCAEDLANRIISIRLISTIKPKLRENTEQNALINRIEKVSDCLGPLRMTRLVDIEEEISSTIIDDVDSYHNNFDYNNNKPNNNVSSQINNHISDAKVTKQIPESTENVDTNTVAASYHTMTPQLSGVLSVYTSKEYNFAATSTPKKTIKKNIPKLNAEEVAYMDTVAELIKSWIETLPKQYNEDKNYKETVVYDLAGDVMDEVKLKELSPEIKSDSDKYLTYITYRWLCRFDFFEDINDAKPMVNDFVKKLKKIPIPKLTRSQHGSRNTIKNIKHMQSEMAHEDFVPHGIDVLEDQISVWMNEQPSEIYAKKDKGARNKQIHDLALNIQDKLRNKSPDSEIEQDVNYWLKKVLKPKEKEHIGILSENLKERIKNTPQDETLGAKVQNMKRERAEYLEARKQTQPDININSNEAKLDIPDLDKTMKEFIIKFMEHNYDIDDPMARGAFSHLLKIELRKLAPQTRKEVYENLSKSNPHEEFSPSQLTKELEYIKLISDWLKNIPIAASYNTVGNRDRVDFVNDLARNIAEAEEQRQQDPTQMDFDVFISSVISQSMRTYQIPILPEHKHNDKLMVDQLMNKIISARTPDATVSSYTDSSIKDDTANIDQNLSEFIEQYIRLNGREIADDEVKLEAWSARLLKEIKKMIHENEDPNTLCKAQVYNRFVDVPIPGDESVKLFGLELEYVKEISEWLKNLPLLSIVNEPDAQNKRIEMISDLAEKLTERTVQKDANPNDSNIDTKTVEYVTNWISKLPLDPQQQIVLPILIQQLMNRIDRVNKKANPIDSPALQILDDSKKLNKSTKSPKERKPPCCNTSKNHNDPGKAVVEAIDVFSNKLPLQGDKETVKAMKDNIAKRLYQKVGELNVDPRVFNDDLMYQEMLEDEIDTQLENVPQNPDLQNQREKLKSDLIVTILDAKNFAKSEAAGEHYKHKLETTIDGSLPNPYQSNQEIDPGFEIYKNHVANMFILENFDHGNDETKAKYENIIRKEIDKFSKNAQSKNAVPMTKDQLYNELYSTLFRVPIPCRKAVAGEVEEVKLRYEIQTWLNGLPLREPTGMPEELERDKIVTTLAKRIHEMEKESKSNEKICKEATKWLNKLPLKPGEDKHIDEFVKNLQKTLKSTAADRKCVTSEPKNTDSKIKFKKSKGTLGTSQTAGPSSAGKNWVSPPASPETKPCCTSLNQQKPADAIIFTVEKWCQQIPLVLSEEESKIMKDTLTTRIIMKICELNSNPELFDNDMMYCELLDEELDKLLTNLPTGPEFIESIPARKYQLIEQLKSIKLLMKEEKAKHEYKADLKNTVSTILREPQNTTEDKLTLFNDLKNDIVENFVQYNYDRDDDVRQLYIQQVHDGVVKYFIDYREQGIKDQDPLIVRNQLMCELSKIPIPSIGAIKDTVEEIKMKKEVEDFFENLPSTKGDAQKEALRKQFKVSLSKRLYDIEKSGHSCPTDRKMKSEISRCLKKLDIEEKSELINSFVDKLRSNEASRKVPPSPQTLSLFKTGEEHTGQSNYQLTDKTDQSYGNFQRGVSMASSRRQALDSQSHQLSVGTMDQSSSASIDKSLDPTNLSYEGFRTGVDINSTKCSQPVYGSPGLPFSSTSSPYVPAADRTGYQGIGAGVNLTSSVQGLEQPSAQNRRQKQEVAHTPCQMSCNAHQPSQIPQGSDRYQQVLRSPNQFTAGSISPTGTVPRHSESIASQQDPQYFKTYEERRTIDQEFSPARKFKKSLGESDVNYDEFSGRVIFKSSLGAIEQPNLLGSQAPTIIQGSPSYTVPRDTDMTSSSIFDAPRLSQIRNEPRFRPEQASNPNTERQRWSQPSYEGIQFLMGEHPHTLHPDGVCGCVKRILKNCKGKPQCSVDINEYCDKCGGFGPMWWRMLPRFIFY